MVELPNVNFRLDQVFLEAQVTVTFTSNDEDDKYASVQPAIVPWASSLINEVRFFCGSTLVSDIRQCNVIYNWQQNLASNSITRLSETYNNPTPVVYTAATAQQFRFPLTHFKNDLWSLENGIWPGEKAQKAYLEIYWEVPAYCIYAQGAIEGSSFSFAYSVSGFNLQIVQVTDPNLNKLMIERPFLINCQEWYWYQQPMQLAATQNVHIPIAFSSIRGIVWGVRSGRLDEQHLGDQAVSDEFRAD